MSGRISKTRISRKTEQRQALALLIDETGFEAMPCSSCRERGWSCKMTEGHSRCAACVRRGRSCDGTGLSLNSGVLPFFLFLFGVLSNLA